MNLDRRQLLRLTGATTAGSVAALAGCTSDGDSSDDTGNGDDGNGDENGEETDPNGDALETAELSYERWLTSDADGELLFSYFDWTGLEDVDELEDDEDERLSEWSEDSEVADPMIDLPMTGAFLVVLTAAFAIPGTGLERIVDMEDDALAATDAETTLDELLFVNETLCFLGDVETGEVVDALTDDGGDDPYASETAFEHADDIGDFEIYEPDDSGDDDGYGTASSETVAVGENAILVADDSETIDGIDHVRSVLEASDGETAADERDEFDWTLETAGDGHIVLGAYSNGDELDDVEPGDDVEDANAIVSSLTFDEDGGAAGDFAATFETIDDETEAEIESDLGATADDLRLEMEDTRVSASASWDADNEVLE
ncbi:hypothetical protein [Natronorubrum sp. FCH18a]|uniref:hypothetical protein n=1 Tax=Natronorubrum sp. FCH18a TaxID=3447018 RepID=UPI003F511267